MSEVVGQVNNYDRKFVYKVDKNGNIIKAKYNILKDPYTLVTLTILILGALYYTEMSNSATNAKNFGTYCLEYSKMVDFWNNNHLENETWNPTESINTLVEFYQINYNRINSIKLYG
jgi:hypothetical protein